MAVTEPRRRRAASPLPRPPLSAVVILAIFVAVVVWGTATTSGFATADNLQAISTSGAFVGVVALGMTLIMIGGFVFSLSLGLTAAVGAIAFLYCLRMGVAPA